MFSRPFNGPTQGTFNHKKVFINCLTANHEKYSGTFTESGKKSPRLSYCRFSNDTERNREDDSVGDEGLPRPRADPSPHFGPLWSLRSRLSDDCHAKTRRPNVIGDLFQILC
ncbi:hypothetical protein GWI33_013262 [Rhynchophorus ferrugineus]|uniref:Uncharacterized protein n=1 Tax=Rhynchophorus ferrugineus TaxID=354439 RepID=A0A834I7E2_RHYFE|nr:hypothetical protein GWI33_013262 [Rhynchophorus ferrugineus]